MYNPMQPLINLATANFEAFSRFSKSSDASRPAKESTGKPGEFNINSLTQAFNSKAFTELTQTCMENYKRFAQECMQGATAAMESGRKSMGQQAEAIKAPLQAMTNAATRSVKAGAEAVERTAVAAVHAATDVTEKATDSVVKATTQTADQLREATANTVHQAESKTDKAIAETGQALEETTKKNEADLRSAANLDGKSDTGHTNRDRPAAPRPAK